MDSTKSLNFVLSISLLSVFILVIGFNYSESTYQIINYIILTCLLFSLYLVNSKSVEQINSSNSDYNEKTLSLLKTALDNLEVAVWIRDQDLKIIYFNKYYSKLIFVIIP